ncbi:glycoside hydrolase domain-containing protein [Amphibacillus jilinensis]|uniref:glycoside hydrolase domain-containing protein n=1 Tax=Amphibacillus jilinensis TaxID=1216008 RepID=UPI0002E6BFE1|nr:glycoside hydrolase domain-containing protein [Amphibacillus jilinensis]
MPYIWGVDSANEATKDLYDCVLTQFGKPEYWGRYLTRVEGASEGITTEEVQLLHNSNTKIMPIYNDFLEAIGERQGLIVAQNAIFHARRLGIPKGKILVANIENFFNIDAAFISGFVEAMYISDYKPGLYHDPDQGQFDRAYCEAVELNDRVAEQTVLWSAEPEYGVTGRRDAPPFQPSEPNCRSNVWGWQYGRDAEACPIDTNLIDQRFYNMLW